MLSKEIIKNYIVDNINRGYTINNIKKELNKRGLSDEAISKIMDEIIEDAKYSQTTTSINYTINSFILWLLKTRWEEIRPLNQFKSNKIIRVFDGEKKIRRKNWVVSLKYILSVDEGVINELESDFKQMCVSYNSKNVINILLFSLLPIKIDEDLLNEKLSFKTFTHGIKSSLVIDLTTRKILTKPIVFPISYSKTILAVRRKLQEVLMLEVDIYEEEKTYHKIKEVKIIQGMSILVIILIALMIVAFIYAKVNNINLIKVIEMQFNMK